MELGNNLCRSIDMLARAMNMSNQATQNQNVFLPNNISNVYPIVPQKVSISQANSSASYA